MISTAKEKGSKGIKKIGIMGGTFNPIHMGHLMLAEAAYEQFSLDEVWFMPNKIPPHKLGQTIVTDTLRANMVELAINGNPHFKLCDVELKREGKSYSVDTLKELHELHADHEYYFIIGADSLFQIDTWKGPETLLKLAHFVAATRGEENKASVLKRIKWVNETYDTDVSYLSLPCIDISSNMIRNMIANGNSIRYYVPDEVYTFIKEHQLYETKDKTDR